jgi:hypothetical protein
MQTFLHHPAYLILNQKRNTIQRGDQITRFISSLPRKTNGVTVVVAAAVAPMP